MSEQVKTVAEVPDGDADFTAFFHADYKPLIKFLVSLGASFAEADDAAQEAMVSVWQRWSKVDNPRAYVRTVARRAFLTTRASGQRHHAAAAEAFRTSEGVVVVDQDGATVIEMLGRLTPREREVMAWTIDGFKPTEIAELMGQPAATVRSNLRYARAKLKAMLDERGRSGREGSGGPHNGS